MRLIAAAAIALAAVPALAGQLDSFDPSAPPTVVQTRPPETTEQLLREQNTLIRQQGETLRRIEQQGERPLPCAPGQIGCRVR